MASSSLYPLTATCVCTAISLSLSSPPNAIYTCHCYLCRKETGSLFAVQVRFPHSAVTVTRGASTLVKYSRPEDVADAETGIKPNAAFCGKCGNPIWCEGPKTIIVRYGFLDVEGDERVEELLKGVKEGGGEEKTEWWPHGEYFVKRRPEWAKGWKVEGAEQNWELKGGKGGGMQDYPE